MNKGSLLLLILAVSSLATDAGAAVDRDGYVVDQGGNLLPVNHEQAVQACAEAGMHLPTLREWAQISQAMGAKGILETSAVENGRVPPGYYLLSVTDPDGKNDAFYFSYEGFKRTNHSSAWLWSSSKGNRYQGYDMDFGGFNEYSGAVHYLYKGDPDAARCFAGTASMSGR